MRRFVFFLVMAVTPIFTARALAQQSVPAVYVVAVKGECVNSKQPYAIPRADADAGSEPVEG
jgi:hypothetical protein